MRVGVGGSSVPEDSRGGDLGAFLLLGVLFGAPFVLFLSLADIRRPLPSRDPSAALFFGIYTLALWGIGIGAVQQVPALGAP
jgi:hypothetical protein